MGVHPGGVGLGQDAGGLAARAVDEVEVEPGLRAVHRLHGDPPAVGRPLHRDDVLVRRRFRVHPGGGAAADVHDAQPDGGVGAARLRVALRDHARHRGLEVDEAHPAHRGLVRAQERDRAPVRRPPVAGVLVVEDLLPVDPRERAVQDRVRAVAREAALGPRGEIQDEEVVAAHEGQPPAVGGQARDRLLLGRAREPLEAGGGEVEQEDVVGEGVGRPAPGPVERLGPGQRLRNARLPDERLQARPRRGPVDGRRPGPGRRHALEGPHVLRLPRVEQQHVPAARPRERRQPRRLLARVAEDPLDGDLALLLGGERAGQRQDESGPAEGRRPSARETRPDGRTPGVGHRTPRELKAARGV